MASGRLNLGAREDIVVTVKISSFQGPGTLGSEEGSESERSVKESTGSRSHVGKKDTSCWLHATIDDQCPGEALFGFSEERRGENCAILLIFRRWGVDWEPRTPRSTCLDRAGRETKRLEPDSPGRGACEM